MKVPPLPLSGYVLAGGRSSRMGSDKALLQLGGRPLAARAVDTLAGLCERVRIVATQPELAAVAATIQDDFVGCGPLGGIEAALRDTVHDWVVILPVDLGFIPQGMLAAWAGLPRDETVRVQHLEAEGYPQPLVALLHRTVLPIVQESLRAGQYRVMQVYAEIARRFAEQASVRPEQVVQRFRVEDDGRLLDSKGREVAWQPSAEEIALRRLWFGNLNTPEELAQTEAWLSEARNGTPASKLEQFR